MTTEKKPWHEQTWLVMDTETTGLDPESSQIIDLAAVTFQAGTCGDTFERLIQPDGPIPAESTEIHGITDDMVQGKPRFHEIASDFLERVQAADVLVAYNWPFDARFLAHELGEDVWKDAIAGKCILDPLVIVRFDRVGRYWKGRGRHRLTAVCERLEIECAGAAHRARADAIMAGHVLWKLRSHLPDDHLEAMQLIVDQRERQDAEFMAWRKRQQGLFS